MRAAVLVAWLALMSFYLLSMPWLPAYVGSPGSEMPKVAYLALMMSVCSFVLLLDLALVPWLLRRAPKLVSLPNRDYWLAEPRREATLVRVQRGLAGIELQLLALFGGLHLLTLLKAQNASLPDEIMLIPGLVMLPFFIIWTVRFQRAFALPKP